MEVGEGGRGSIYVGGRGPPIHRLPGTHPPHTRIRARSTLLGAHLLRCVPIEVLQALTGPRGGTSSPADAVAGDGFDYSTSTSTSTATSTALYCSTSTFSTTLVGQTHGPRASHLHHVHHSGGLERLYPAWSGLERPGAAKPRPPPRPLLLYARASPAASPPPPSRCRAP